MDKKLYKEFKKHNKKLYKVIEEREELIDFLFKRLQDWNDLVNDTQKYSDKLHNFNMKYLKYCSILMITNIITIAFFIIYIIGRP